MSSEVLIYIQNLKIYFEKHPDAQKYFTPDGNGDAFFEYMSKISQENFDEHGDAQLTLEQFEEARQKTIKTVDDTKITTGIFLSLGDLGYVSLN